MSVHPNDMRHWDAIRCQRGCDIHFTRHVDIHLGGPTRYRDLTPIPHRFAAQFDIEIWDTEEHPVDGGSYCPAHDAVSETILSHGVWEPRETTVILAALEALGEHATFLDIGAQIGWFSTVAGHHGYPVMAIEADPDVADVLRRNLDSTGTDHAVTVMRVGPNTGLTTPILPYTVDPARFVAKIDIEGAEPDAIDALRRHIVNGSIPFILMEISPVFHDRYPAMVSDLFAFGYRAFLMPPKSRPPFVINELSDLAPLEFTDASTVADWHQEDVLFADPEMMA